MVKTQDPAAKPYVWKSLKVFRLEKNKVKTDKGKSTLIESDDGKE